MNIKEFRKRHNLSQTELAEILGLGAYSRVSEYENGKQRPGKTVIILLKLIDKNPELIELIRKIVRK